MAKITPKKSRKGSGRKPTLNGTLKSVSKKLKVEEYLDYKLFLGDLFDECKKKISDLNYLKFAEALGLSGTNVLYLVVSGRRKLTDYIAEKILEELHWKGHRRKYFLTLVRYQNSKKNEEKRQYLAQIFDLKRNLVADKSQDKEQLKLFSKWYYPILLEFLRVKGAPSDPERVAEAFRFSVSAAEIEQGFMVLEKNGFLERSDSGQWAVRHQQIQPSKKVMDVAHVNYHKEMTRLADDALSLVDIGDRDFNSISLTLSAEGFKKIKDLLRKTCREIIEIEHQDEKRQLVAQVNVNLFKVTHDLASQDLSEAEENSISKETDNEKK